MKQCIPTITDKETARKCVGRIVESNIAVSSGKVNLEEARPNKEGLYG